MYGVVDTEMIELTPLRAALAASLAFLFPLPALEAPPVVKRISIRSCELAIAAIAVRNEDSLRRPISRTQLKPRCAGSSG